MCMQDTANIVAGFVNGAMDHRACAVDAIAQATKIRAAEHFAGKVDFKQARGSDFFVHHAVRVDQKHTFFARDASGNMIGNHVRQAIHINQAVTGGQIDARLPFSLRDFAFE